MSGQQTDMFEAVRSIADSRKVCGSHAGRMAELLRHFAAKNICLATLCDRHHLNRGWATLTKYARELGLKFPDYTSREMKAAEKKAEADRRFGQPHHGHAKRKRTSKNGK